MVHREVKLMVPSVEPELNIQATRNVQPKESRSQQLSSFEE